MKLSKEIINEFTKQHLEQTYTILQLYFEFLAATKCSINHRSWNQIASDLDKSFFLETLMDEYNTFTCLYIVGTALITHFCSTLWGKMLVEVVILDWQ